LIVLHDSSPTSANRNFFVSAGKNGQGFVAGRVKLEMDSMFTVNLRLTLALRPSASRVKSSLN
jgi:hypothetical protein